MKYLKLLKESSKGYTNSLINSMLSRYELMKKSWTKVDHNKLTSLLQKQISDLDEEIKISEKELERKKKRRNDLSKSYLKYRQSYNNIKSNDTEI